MLWKLNCGLIRTSDGYLFLGRREAKLNFDSPEVKHLMRDLANGVDEVFIKTIEDNPRFQSFIKQLKQKNLLIPYDSTYKNTYLESTYNFLNWHVGSVAKPVDFNRAFHIGIIGCGGLGANVALYLASSGIAKFTLIDGDSVEPRNLNRQYPYTTSDLGVSKSIALKKHLMSIDSSISVHSKQNWISSPQSIKESFGEDVPEFILCGIDSPPVEAKMIVSQFSRDYKIPTFFAGVGHANISIGPLLDDEEAFRSYVEQLQKIKDEIDVDFTTPISASSAATNTICSSIVANEIMSYIYKIAEPISRNSQIVFDPFQLSIISKTAYCKKNT
ncbi:MAG: hypothetical protein A3I05_02395 [Deltaproteobacteria bacterium RIFCSPLOWO2_02_FULL_44_10]|nr:MAG: hypothetical protein A3I05_02395 [Deltaproteobacteria bacterium RIFCSPLOWO2_02_FULL_44_10]